jgi:uncharacterized membrane protein YphA (DoxX/SURF4 family)
MLPRIAFLLTLIVAGAAAGAALSRRLERIEPARLARGYLVAVAALMCLRVVAYMVANVFGVKAVRPASTGPYDLTNLLVGGLYGLAAVHARRGGFGAFLRAPDLLLALRLSAGVAFLLAGLVNVFIMDATGVDYFVEVGYTKTFHLFIMTAEVLGGAALLLPWRWLTMATAAGLTIDMFGALYTQARSGDPLDAAAIAMLLRLAPLVGLSVKGRWATVGAVACAIVAIVGAAILHHHQ